MLSVFRTFGFRSLIIAVVLAGLACLGGCSALRIAYGTAPDLVYWWLDAYVDFDDAQAPRARDAIKQWFAWSRRTQLPDYAGLLARARIEVAADTSAGRVCEWQAEGVKRAHAALDRIAPAMAELMLTITPDQIAHIEQHYAKRNDEFRGDFLQPDPRKRAEANFKRTLDRAETLYGKLGSPQRARIDEGLTHSPFDAEVWIAERRQRQLDALQVLRKLTAEKATRDQALAALNGYVERLEHSPREPYRRYAERLAEFNCDFAANVHNTTTSAQRRVAADNLAGWEGDLRALAAASPREGN